MIGSVKSNIGHAEGAAGVAAFIKMSLSLWKGMIPANMGFDKINPKIQSGIFNLQVLDKHTPLPKDRTIVNQGYPACSAIVGINSFGMGGTNCHIILQNFDRAQQQHGSFSVAHPRFLQERPAIASTANIDAASSSSAMFPAPLILTISAKNPEALKQLASSYQKTIESRTCAESGEESMRTTLRDICFSASARRTHYSHRLAICFRSKEELLVRKEQNKSPLLPIEQYSINMNKEILTYKRLLPPLVSSSLPLPPPPPKKKAQLSSFCSENSSGVDQSLLKASFKSSGQVEAASSSSQKKRGSVGGRKRLAFVFSGQGPQWFAMGRQLFEREPVFRKVVVEIDQELEKVMREHASQLQRQGPGAEDSAARFQAFSLVEEMMMKSESDSLINQTNVAQPAIFALQFALYALLRSWGIEADVIVGHSVGEVAAALAAGAISFKDSIRIIYHRSRLQHATAGRGKMMAASLSAEEALSLLQGVEDKVCIAAINSPNSVTLAGDEKILQELGFILDQRKTFKAMLRTQSAFHSPQMYALISPSIPPSLSLSLPLSPSFHLGSSLCRN